MKKIFVCSVVLVCLAIIVAGCSKGTNIFGWMAPGGGSAGGDANYANGNYELSMADYEAAVNANYGDSKSRYGYVKSYVKSIGFDLATFLQNYSDQTGGAPAFVIPAVSDKVLSKTPYYLIDDPTKPFGVDLVKFERLVYVLIYYLEPIADGKCDGYINPKGVGLNVNLAFAHLLRAVFYLIDYDYNGVMDYNIRKDDDGSEHIVQLPNLNEVSGLILQGRGNAMTELDLALLRLETAISNSVAANSELWPEIKKIIDNLRNALNS